MYSKKVTAIEYMCAYCGQKRLKGITSGRPDPGKCPRRQNNLPHRWIKNKNVYGAVMK